MMKIAVGIVEVDVQPVFTDIFSMMTGYVRQFKNSVKITILQTVSATAVILVISFGMENVCLRIHFVFYLIAYRKSALDACKGLSSWVIGAKK
jgi:hypothetical protein